MSNTTKNPIRTIATAVALMLAGTGSAVAADWSDMTQDAKDAYRHGQIWASYATSPVLEAREIDVDVSGDTVTLNGTVETISEKRLAGLIADSADGITKVDNKLLVDPELIVITTITPMRIFAQQVADAELANNIDSMLLWNQYTDALDIDVASRNGVITLTGVADTMGAKKRAETIALGAMGTKAVINDLRVDGNSAQESTAGVSDDWIKHKIADTYLFSAFVNSTMVDVEVDDGAVSLKGEVANSFERARAIQLAQDTRGVEKVDASELAVAVQS